MTSFPCQNESLSDEALRFGPDSIRFKSQEVFSPQCPIRVIRRTNHNFESKVAQVHDEFERYCYYSTTTLEGDPCSWIPYPFDPARVATSCFCLNPIPTWVAVKEKQESDIYRHSYSLPGKVNIQIDILDNDEVLAPYSKTYRAFYLDTAIWSYNFEEVLVEFYQDRNSDFKVEYTPKPKEVNDPVVKFEPLYSDSDIEDNYVKFEEDNLSIEFLGLTDAKLTIQILG